MTIKLAFNLEDERIYARQHAEIDEYHFGKKKPQILLINLTVAYSSLRSAYFAGNRKYCLILQAGRQVSHVMLFVCVHSNIQSIVWFVTQGIVGNLKRMKCYPFV